MLLAGVTIFMVVMVVIVFINIILSVRDLVKSKEDEKIKGMVRHRTVLTAKLILVVLILFSANRALVTSNNNQKIGDMESLIVDMYTSEPEDVGEQMQKYKNLFEEKAFQSIDGTDNVENIINKYNKYSSEDNRVTIIDKMASYNNVYVFYNIVNDGEETEPRLAVFERGLTHKIKKFSDYELGEVGGE